MRKQYIFLLLLSFTANLASATGGSKVRELALLAKTWGLLKYYHPGIAQGGQDWDSVLVASLGRVLPNSRPGQVGKEVDRLLLLAGENSSPALQRRTRTVHMDRNYDVSWIGRDRLLSAAQRRLLLHTVDHPFQGHNFYALPNPDNDRTVFTPNEKPYPEMLHPDASYRLLSLFRFWNVVQYFYPYKYAIGRKWDTVLQELIPQMIEAGDTASYHRALARMSSSINDSHGSLWPGVFETFTGTYSPPFDFILAGGKAVVTRAGQPAAAGDQIAVGSVIESIDGVKVRERIRRNLGFVPASNYGGKLKTMHGFILNTELPEARYTGTDRSGRKFVARTSQVKRNFLKDYLTFFRMTSPVAAKVMDGNIGYVFFSNINRKNLDSAMRALKDTKAILFDMRNYPADGYGTYYLPDYIATSPRIYARNTYPDFSLPGMFGCKVANDDTQVGTVGKNNLHPYQGKLILLVDQRTQSAAEWACMTLMAAAKVTVIGNPTAGADGNVTRSVLPGNYKISFSGLGIYFPDGSETQRKGIPIDIRVDYSIKDWASGRDPVLERALKFARR